MRCVALFSGGLDSQLAVRVIQRQSIEVIAVCFQSVFTTCQTQAEQAARRLNVPLTVLQAEPAYLELIRRPRFGYGRGANPCVDCRTHMLQRAFAFMQQCEAQFVLTGEVVGQRPMSQKRRDLETIAHHSGHYDLLLRPLSAKILAPTKPEREGWVDRQQLYGFFGRGRRQLIALARTLELEEIPVPTSGCLLTDESFARKTRDLFRHQPAVSLWEFELLKHGRHFRYRDEAKVVVGRRESENLALQQLFSRVPSTSWALLEPESFTGPVAIVAGPPSDAVLDFACGLIARYSKDPTTKGREVRLTIGGVQTRRTFGTHAAAQLAKSLSEA